jgi:fatty-acyl-CoA synthase
MVPINLNYRYVAPELQYVAENAKLAALIYERSFGDLVETSCAGLPVRRRLVALDDETSRPHSLGPFAEGIIGYGEALASAAPHRPGLRTGSGDDLYVLYTGGTTGLPKGVVWHQEDLYLGPLGGSARRGGAVTNRKEFVNNLPSAESRQIALVIPPLMHGTGQWMTLSCLLSGGTAVLYTHPRFSADLVWQLVSQEAISILVMVGDVMGRPLADSVSDADDVSSLSTLVTSGAPLSESVRDELLLVLPGLRIINRLGSSESGLIGSASASGSKPELTKSRFSVSDDTAVLDDQLQPLTAGDGRIGRLARRGYIPIGYYGYPAKTTETFVIDSKGVRWVLTGDSAMVLEDGEIELLGRGSTTINSGGEKVFPQEVESALKSHPQIFDAIVVGIPDERYGQAVAAVIQARAGASPSLEQLTEHCRKSIAGFKVPKKIVILDKIPVTAVGKPDILAARSLLE